MRALLTLALLASPGLAWQGPIDVSRPGNTVTPPMNLRSGPRAGSAADDFNRAPGSDMGPDWTEIVGDFGIINNTGYAMSGGNQWMQHTSLSAPYADSVQEIDFLPDAGSSLLLYTALVCGLDPNTGETIFIKVQDNNLDLIYDRVYFYHGINGTAWGPSAYFFDLATPTPSGRMRVSFTGGGDIAVLELDNNFDGTWDEQFSCDGLLTSGLTFGTEFGIGAFDQTSFDNWVVNGGGEPGFAYCPGDGVAPHTSCPCVNNNNGAMGGCDWGDPAFPEGGILTAVGSDSMAANNAVLEATGVANDFGVFFGANNAVNGGNGNPLNDGLRCAGGGLIRLIPPTVASGNQMTLPGPLQTLDTGAAAGVTRRYQYWFRTPAGPCGLQANLTNGYEIVWMP